MIDKPKRKYRNRTKIINNITVKVSAKADMDVELHDRLEEQERFAKGLQKHLNKWWKTQTDKKFILIVDYGNLAKCTTNFSYKVELTQLKMDDETIERFKTGVEKIIKEWV